MRWNAFFFAVPACFYAVVASCPKEYLLSVFGYAESTANESKITEHFEKLFDLCGQENIAVYFDNETFGISTYCIDNPNRTLQATFHSLLLQNVTFSTYACNGQLRNVDINQSLLRFTVKCKESDLNQEGKEVDRKKEIKCAYRRHRRFRHHHHHHLHHHHHPFRHFGFYPHMYMYAFPYYPFYPYYGYPGVRAFPIIYDDPMPGNYSGRFIRGNSNILWVIFACIVIFLLLCGLGLCIVLYIRRKMHVHEMHHFNEVYMLPSSPVGIPYGQLTSNYVVNDGQQANIHKTAAQVDNTYSAQ